MFCLAANHLFIVVLNFYCAHRSCLKRPPLADCTNSQVIGNALVKKSIRRVHFQLPEEEPVLNFKKRMNSSNYSDYKGMILADLYKNSKFQSKSGIIEHDFLLR